MPPYGVLDERQTLRSHAPRAAARARPSGGAAPPRPHLVHHRRSARRCGLFGIMPVVRGVRERPAHLLPAPRHAHRLRPRRLMKFMSERSAPGLSATAVILVTDGTYNMLVSGSHAAPCHSAAPCAAGICSVRAPAASATIGG